MKLKKTMLASSLALAFSINLFAQEVYTIEDKTLKEALEIISKKSNLSYIVNDKLLDSKQKFTIKNVEGLQKALKKLFQETKYKAIIKNNAIVIVEKKEQVNNSLDNYNKLDNYTIVESHQAYQGDFTRLETPQSELKIDAQTIKNSGAVNLDQALDLSSSVSRQNNFGGLWNSFAVRGFIGDENLPSNYLVNGFNAGRGFGGPRDLSGVESVEVLKGPRSALFGRGEPGGTINLVTKRPTFETKGELKLTAGSFDTYRSDLDWTSPVSENLAIRLVGFYEDAESFRDTVETEKYGLNPSILYLINDNSQISYELEYSHQEIPMDRGVIAIDGKLGKISESRYLGEPSYGNIETEVVGHQLEYQNDFNDDWSVLVGLNYRDTTFEGYASENGFNAPDDNGNFNRFTRYRDYDTKYQVLRAELSGGFDTVGLKHRIIMGMDVDKFENDQFATRDRTTNQSINIYNPQYGNYPISSLDLAVQIDTVETQESFGIYLQDQISLTDNLDIRLGARFDDYEQELVDSLRNTKSKYSESQISPQVGAVYSINDSLSVYATYGENFRPLSGATDENNIDPNESKSTELGINFGLNDGALMGNFAIFKVEQSNIATLDNNGDFNAIGEAQSEGVELDLYGNITDSLSLWFSYTYIEAKTKNEFTSATTYDNVPSNSDMLNIANNQLSLQLAQEIRLAGRELNVIGGLVYVGERSGEFGTDFKLPSYTTVRLAANYQLSKSLELGAQIDNLFDKEYYTNSYSDTWVQPGTPRSMNVSLTYKF